MLTNEIVCEQFNEGFDCSMVVMAEIAKDIGLTEEQARRISSCFGVGMMEATVCGAVSAAFMAIGYRYGNTEPNDFATKGLVMAKKAEFLEKFKKEFGDDITCPGLMKGLDVRDPDDAAKAKEMKLMSESCPRLCMESARIIREII